MIRALPHTPVIARTVLSGALLAAAVATGAPLVGDLLPEGVRAREAMVDLPLAGHWETMANGDRINRVIADGDTVWVAAEAGGVVRWDVPSRTYKQYLAPQDGLPSNVVRDVVLAVDGSLWAATGRGLGRLVSGEEYFEAITPVTSTGMPARFVTALAPRSDGKIWVGFAQEWDPVAVDPGSREPVTFIKGGLALYDPATDVWELEYHVETGGTWADPHFESITSENVVDLELATDGILWVGTEPHFVWDQNTVSDPDGPKELGWWQYAGGGLAATKDGEWTHWYGGSSASGGCYSNIIRDLAAGVDGQMWVGASDGLLAMRNGLTRVGCEGQPRYSRARRDAPGMRGRSVFSVEVASDGRIWVGNAEGRRSGLGIGILDYGGTLDDYDAWDSNDFWEFVDLDNMPGSSDLVVTDIKFLDNGHVVMGTANNRTREGDGLRVYDPGARTWTPLRMADDGLPSNYISDIKRDPVSGALWVSTGHSGVARFDGQHWRTWRMFGPGDVVARSTVNANAGISSIPVDFADYAAYEAAFPVHPRYARIGNDPTLYRITGFTVSSKSIRLTPKLVRSAPSGTLVHAIDRGPASNNSTQIAIGEDGHVWVGGRETVWLGNCATFPHCWLDGGLGRFDGENWTVYNLSKAETGLEVQDQEVQSVEIDKSGRVWVGTGNPFEGLDGKGIFVFDPADESWTLHSMKRHGAANFGGNGVPDMDLDEESGDMWIVSHSVEICDQSSPFGDACQPSFVGGGVSRFDGTDWRKWSKRSGATLRAAGAEGEMESIKVDRFRDRVWAGTFDDSSTSFHWLQGRDVHAVLNWCPLDCGNEDWEHFVFEGDGEVAAIEVDDTGNLWVGSNRFGNGDIPPIGGINIYNDQAWFNYHPDNSGLPSREITMLQADGDEMWVGTYANGIAHYLPEPLATPTPIASKTPLPTLTSTPLSTDEPTPTPGGTWYPTATGQTPGTAGTPGTPGPLPKCGEEGGICYLYAPLVVQKRLCGRDCPTLPPSSPTPVRASTSTPTRSLATATTTPAGPLTPSPTWTATQTGPPTLSPTHTQTTVATSGASSTPTLTPTPTRTRTPTITPTDAVPPSPTTPPVMEWAAFNGTVPRDTFFSVHGIDAEHVWFAGERSQVLFWDGNQMNQQKDVIQPNKVLRQVFMMTATRGYLVGEDGVFMETRDGGQLWRRTNNVDLYIDDWATVNVVPVDRGYRGWALGNLNGNRLFFDGTRWAPSGPADRNNRTHKYSDVALLGPSKAFAIQSNPTGARMYEWNGSDWRPGTSTGPLYDMHVLSETSGVAVGARGTVYWLDADGEWSRGEAPRTAGQDLNAVHMVAEDQIWAAGGRGQIWLWNGVEWSSESVSGQIDPIHSLWLTPDGTEGWAVGGDGQFLRYGVGP
jgi:ligand-binding sensor domain-containing protein